VKDNNLVGMEKLKEIIFHYNKKFPYEKIDIQKIQDITIEP